MDSLLAADICLHCHGRVDGDVEECPTCHHHAHEQECGCARCVREAFAHALRPLDAGLDVEVTHLPHPTEDVGEHVFPADPRALALCENCGVSLEQAYITRRCGA